MHTQDKRDKIILWFHPASIMAIRPVMTVNLPKESMP